MIFEHIYSIVIILSCLFVYFKTKKIYDLTSHKGISAFRRAFLYWGIAFFSRYIGILSEPFLEVQLKYTLNVIIGLIFFYGLSMAGFSLVYSLVWKNLQQKQIILQIAAITVAFLDLFYIKNIMFYTQFVVILYGIHLSYNNYKNSGSKHKFLQFYYIGLILAFLGYFVNFFGMTIYAYVITTLVFLIFDYGVFKVIK